MNDSALSWTQDRRTMAGRRLKGFDRESSNPRGVQFSFVVASRDERNGCHAA